MPKKMTSSASRFDNHGDAPEHYRQHCPMRHIQGYSGSHWMPALGNYLLHISPAAAKMTINKTTIKQYTNKAGCFDGHHDAMVQYHAHYSMEEVQGFTRSH
jgi:hypothetical protein